MPSICLLKKAVDRSTLYDGFTIPLAFQEVFQRQMGFVLAHGETRPLKLLCEGVEYDAQITNTGFDRNRFRHSEILQIRYTRGSAFARLMRETFTATLEAIARSDEHRIGRERYQPEEADREYLVIYATPVAGTLMAECITREEYRGEAAELREKDEFSLESMIDTGAAIEVREKKQKIRRMTRAIGDTLKLVYGYRCQICGQYIGEPYGSNVIHAHHIDYFVRSLNNDANNIMIVCPNHHAIIHDRNPVFDRKHILYEYPNGYKEGLVLNRHL